MRDEVGPPTTRTPPGTDPRVRSRRPRDGLLDTSFRERNAIEMVDRKVWPDGAREAPLAANGCARADTPPDRRRTVHPADRPRTRPRRAPGSHPDHHRPGTERRQKAHAGEISGVVLRASRATQRVEYKLRRTPPGTDSGAGPREARARARAGGGGEDGQARDERGAKGEPEERSAGGRPRADRDGGPRQGHVRLVG